MKESPASSLYLANTLHQVKVEAQLVLDRFPTDADHSEKLAQAIAAIGECVDELERVADESREKMGLPPYQRTPPRDD